MHLSEIWHSKKNDCRLSRTQVKNSTYKHSVMTAVPQKGIATMTQEGAKRRNDAHTGAPNTYIRSENQVQQKNNKLI